MAENQAILRLCILVLSLIFSLVFSVSSTPLCRTKSLDAIKQLNAKGPYIGLITVYPPEEDSFFKTGAFRPSPEHPFVDLSGRRFRVGTIHGKRVNAVAATQQMLDLFYIEGIIHFGIAGNVNNSLSIGDVTIPRQLSHTGIWDWLKPNGKLPSNDVAHLDFGSYNAPEGGANLLGRIGYSYEEFFSESGKPNTMEPIFWVNISEHWLHLASNLKENELVQCVNSSMCLPRKPKLVVGLKGSTANIFLDNPAYRDFLIQTFGVSSVDMESVAVVLTSLSNGFPVIVIRGLSDLAGGQPGKNPIDVFGPLAALNAAQIVVQFIKELP
ncbi:Nucleoside phosphorylase domain [Dillenia turbinata]|uniref:Nucleoside phosphorylase domain n=1 Tax=Dillenia turbinata TaxID=194707 RepID=A0AAN8VKP8_9MAGN